MDNFYPDAWQIPVFQFSPWCLSDMFAGKALRYTESRLVISIKMETLFHTIMSIYFVFQVHFLFLIKKALQRAFHMVQIFIWKQIFFSKELNCIGTFISTALMTERPHIHFYLLLSCSVITLIKLSVLFIHFLYFIALLGSRATW